MQKPKSSIWDFPVKGSYSLDDDDLKPKYNDLYKDDLYGAPSYSPKDYWDFEEKSDGIPKKIYDDWVYETTEPYNIDSVGIHNSRLVDKEEVHARWAGALVQFSSPYYPRGITAFPDLIVTTTVHPPHSPELSRKVRGREDTRPQYTGTVINVDDKPGYRGQWCVSILWADGIISYENILDLEIIQPGPG